MANVVVQEKDGVTTSTTTLTLTFATSITAGNGIIVAHADESIVISCSGGTDTFTSIAGASVANGFFYVLSSNGGYTSITVTTSGGTSGFAAWAYEVSPLQAFDVKTGTNTNTPTLWTSGALTGGFPNEIFIGIGHSNWFGGTASTITGPSSPWVNHTSQKLPGIADIMLSGHQIVTSTSTLTYNGTATGSGSGQQWSDIAAFRFAPPFSPAGKTILRQAVKRRAFY